MTPESRRIPELSLRDFTRGDANTRAAFGSTLFAALQTYGFFILKDHDVPLELLDDAYRLGAQFFSSDDAHKRRYAGGLRGYTPFGTEHAKNNPFPDLKEFWQVGRTLPPGSSADEIFPPNIWPDDLPQFRSVFTTLFDSLDETARLMLQALAPSLQLPADYFDAQVRHGNSILRLIHYPPIPHDADPHCVRSAAHEDINFLTILVAATRSGLELLDEDGRWLPIETAPRNLIVDSGDMLARLTNGVIPAKTHRVVNPAGANESRYSMPFFMHPSNDTSLACLPSCLGTGAKYPPITAGEFLSQRLREIGLAR